MIKLVATVLFLLLPFISQAKSFDNIGFKELTINDDHIHRPLNIKLLYPTTQSTSSTLLADSAVFYGFKAISKALPATESYPLFIISHGYGGNWRNLSWLAADLAHNGYIVALVEHPGTTTFDRDPTQAAQLWQRSQDLSRTITFLEQNLSVAGMINPAKIIVAGHSLGGWTAMVAGGAQFDVNQFKQDCLVNSSPRTCELSDELGIIAQNQNKFDSLKDPRISQIITFDIGLARGFTAESLTHISIPVLIIGAGIDIGDLPVEMESGYLANHLLDDRTSYIVLDQAMHFSFMPQCKEGAIELLIKGGMGDEIICKDGFDTTRSQLHQQMLTEIKQFLQINK